METHFQRLMKKKTEQELQAYVDDAERFQKEAVIAAIQELQDRKKADKSTTELRESLEKELIEKEKRTEKDKEEFIIPKDLPPSVYWAAYLVYFSFVIGIINTIIKVNMDIMEDLSSFSNVVYLMFTVIFMVFMGYTIHLGKAWARTLYLIIVIIGGIISYPIHLINLFVENPVVGSILLFQAAIQFIALFLLYSPKSEVWYRKVKWKREAEEELIEV